MIKNYYLLNILLFLLAIPSKGQMTSKVNTSYFTTDKESISNLSHSSEKNGFAEHPESGKLPYNAPCEDCYELIEKRTAYSRYFITNNPAKKEFHQQQSYTPMHFKNPQGFWVSIDRRLRKKGAHLYRVEHPYSPVEIDMAENRCLIFNEGKTLVYNNQMELFSEDVNHVLQSRGKANWSDYSAGDGGIYIRNCWDGIDMEMQMVNGGIKTNFILRKKPAFGFNNLIIRDYPSYNGKIEKEAQTFSVKDFHSNQELFSIGGIYAYESRTQSSPMEFNYRIQENSLDIEIPGTWVNNNSLAWPLIIDPLVSSSNTKLKATMLYSGYNPTCNVGFCSYNMDVPVPSKSTIVDIKFQYAYLAGSPCNQNQGGFKIISKSCESGNWGCPDAIPGICNSSSVSPTGISIFNDVKNCLPGRKCPDYTMPFEFRFSRCAGPGAGCAASCINSDADWIMTITGRTLEVSTTLPNPMPPSTQTVCEGNPVTLAVEGEYGVYPYYYSWAPGGETTASITVTPKTNTVYTATITDDCGNTATKNFTVNVTPSTNPGFTITPDIICLGTSANISASGTSPVSSYDWEVKGFNNSTFLDQKSFNYSNAFSGLFDITLNFTDGGCIFPLTKKLEILDVSKGPIINITSDPLMPVCGGSVPITLKANQSNQDYKNPYVLKWNVNGAFVGNGVTYTSSSLKNGDKIDVEISIFGNVCTGFRDGRSPIFTYTVKQPTTPAVSIQMSPNTLVCPGANVTFTASPVNGGSAPVYQWVLNGYPAGTNSNTFSSTKFKDGDEVSVVLFSNESCQNTNIARSSILTVPVQGIKIPSLSIASNTVSPFCQGTNVTFTATPVNGGSTPSFRWRINGQLVAGANGITYSTTTLKTNDIVTAEMTSSETCPGPNPVAISNSITVTVTPNVIPAVTITASPTLPVCAGAPVTFTASPVNEGTTPTYQWTLNNNPVGTNSSTFISSTLANGDQVRVTLTSSVTCVQPTSITSAAFNVSITSLVTPSVAIQALPSTPICPGTNVTFTASPTNGGSSPTYQWTLNNQNVGTNSATFSSTTLVNGDQVRVTLTSNANCLASTTAASTVFNASVNPLTIPSVSIVSDANGAVCQGANITFTASPVNGGTSPAYKWRINGVVVNGASNSTFSSSTLKNNDIITVEMTSNATCPGANPVATSNGITVSITTNLTPALSIVADQTMPVCAGKAIVFTANPTNGGATPSYKWTLNGNPAGIDSPTFTSSTLSNNDNVQVTLTSSVKCVTQSSATSNTIQVGITPLVTPSVTVQMNPATPVCQGVNISFTATPVNGGSAPSYQWTVNGQNVGTNSASFSSSTLQDGDLVQVTLTSNANCTSVSTASSTPLKATVLSITNPSLSITSDITGSACQGANVTFTATPINGGSTPAYKWKINGTVVNGASNSTFSSSSLKNNDIVTVEMTSSAVCPGTNPVVTSNPITVNITTNLTPSVTVSADKTFPVCAGTSVTFSATPSNEGTTPSYKWTVNGNPSGIDSPTFTSSTLSNNDNVQVTLTSSVKCVTQSFATSNTIQVGITPLVTPSVTVQMNPATPVCQGAGISFVATPVNGGVAPSYQWTVNGQNVGTNSASFSSSTLQDGDLVQVTLTSNANCTSASTASSTPAKAAVLSITNPSVSIASDINGSACQGANVTFTATPVNGGTSPTYKWTVNGNVVNGFSGSTFSSFTLKNNDIVAVEMTSSAVCPGTNPVATSNPITVNITTNLTPSVTIIADKVFPVCAGTSVTFSATPSNEGTTPSYKWTVNGNPAGIDSPTFTSSTLSNNDNVQVTLTSSVKCVTQSSATSNTIQVGITSLVTPSVTVQMNPATPVCQGASVSFTATPVNGGPAPSYQWTVNGQNVGTNSASFSSITLQDGDLVQVTLTSNANCTSISTASSTPIKALILSITNPSVSITSDINGSACQGANITFTATPVNGGASPTYKWTVNGNVVNGVSGSNLSSSTLKNNDIVAVEMTSSANCPGTNPIAQSSPLTITVISNVDPSVTVAVDQTNAVCAGTTLTFTASPVNGGNAPIFQWKVNNNVVGTNSPTFTSNSLKNGDLVSVSLTSDIACVSNRTVNSADIAASIISLLTPSVTIQQNPSNNICPGTTITFQAIPVNGGTTPIYEWTVNNQVVGTNADTYTTSALSNADEVKVKITSSEQCLTNVSDFSDPINVVILPVKSPQVSISNNLNGPACTGSPVVFNAQPVNGGNNPSFKWKVNGTDVPGATLPNFTSSTLATGDIVTVEMTSNETCPGPNPVIESSGITMNVLPLNISTVTITPDSTQPVCSGTPVTFSVQATNEGTNPTYQWTINGSDVSGETASTFKSSSFKDGDLVAVKLKSSIPCSTPSEVASASYAMKVLPNLTGTVNISSTPVMPACEGIPINFQATFNNMGTNPTFDWKVNGTTSGTNTASFTPANPKSNDVIELTMKPDGKCFTASSFSSNQVTLNILPSLIPGVSIIPITTDTVCNNQYTLSFKATPTNGGTNPTYQWLLNGVPVGGNSNSYSNPSLKANDTIQVIMGSDYLCKTLPGALSNKIPIKSYPPIVPDLGSDIGICLGESTSLNVKISGGKGPYKVNWSNGSSSNSINVNPKQTTRYKITVNDQCGTTTGIDSINVTVNPLPDASFTWSPDEIILSLNPAVQFSNSNTAPLTYQWDFGDGSQSTDSNPIHQYLKTGEFNVQLFVKDNLGCKNSSSDKINIKDLFLFYIPNTFSPNSDGLNDQFEVLFNTPVPFTFEIFNRWGEMIYSGDEKSAFWDGKSKNSNKLVEDGVYTYKLVYRVGRQTNETGIVLRGYITVLKNG